MNPSPTFLESLQPQERYELLQKARGDQLGGILVPITVHRLHLVSLSSVVAR